ncbi:MAG: hypothetical protein ACOCZB_07850 [Spirochaetota bacterium]
MISLNLNAIQEWERVRRDTEPHTPDVDRNPGTEQPDSVDIQDGSHGNRVRPVRRRRRPTDETAPDQDGPDDIEAYEVDIGTDDQGFGPPPDGPRAPTQPYQGRHVDEEA